MNVIFFIHSFFVRLFCDCRCVNHISIALFSPGHYNEHWQKGRGLRWCVYPRLNLEKQKERTTEKEKIPKMLYFVWVGMKYLFMSLVGFERRLGSDISFGILWWTLPSYDLFQGYVHLFLTNYNWLPSISFYINYWKVPNYHKVLLPRLSKIKHMYVVHVLKWAVSRNSYF